ncbi:unnamed protein product, partial [Discosporangium mesarthrocarpum]
RVPRNGDGVGSGVLRRRPNSGPFCRCHALPLYRMNGIYVPGPSAHALCLRGSLRIPKQVIILDLGWYLEPLQWSKFASLLWYSAPCHANGAAIDYIPRKVRVQLAKNAFDFACVVSH